MSNIIYDAVLFFFIGNLMRISKSNKSKTRCNRHILISDLESVSHNTFYKKKTTTFLKM